MGRNIVNAPTAAIEYALATSFYDLFLSEKKALTRGNKEVGEKVAVYVIFPVNGIESKHEHALSYLNSAKYTPILIVNGKLFQHDREKVQKQCAIIIERVNFGYDFGGYREGVLFTRSMNITPRFLLLLNDSCWFPVKGTTSWLDEAEGLGVELASALTHSGSGWIRRSLRPSLCTKAQLKRGNRKRHHCSFAILFSNAALMRAEFWHFWERIHLSSRRSRTVRWGERALTMFAEKNKLSRGSTLTELDVAAALVAHFGPSVMDANGDPAYVFRDFLVSELKFQFYKSKGC